MKKLELHWRILIGMVLGLLFGFIMLQTSWGKEFTNDWIKPLGTIFVNLLKLIAIPLILASLIICSPCEESFKFKTESGPATQVPNSNFKISFERLTVVSSALAEFCDLLLPRDERVPFFHVS